MQDEMYMARAMKLAQRGRFTTHPNPNVGCVIVKEGEIVGEFDPRTTNVQELGLYMAGAKRKEGGA